MQRLVANVVYKFLRTKVFVARRVARSSVNGLSKLALRSIAAVKAAIIRRASHEISLRVNAISGSRTAEGGTRPGAGTSRSKRVAALRTAVACSYRIQKKGGSSNLSRLRAAHTNVHKLPPAAEVDGQNRCPEVGPSLSGPAPIPEISISASKWFPKPLLGDVARSLGSLDSGPGRFGTSYVA